MNTEKQRQDFEAWYEQEFGDTFGPLVWQPEDEAYENVDHQLAYQAWLGATRAALLAERDALREALQELYDAIDSCADLTPEVMKKARAALAQEQGEKHDKQD